MAISRIRGEQIRDGVLVNAHIGTGAAIDETKLNIGWSSHYQEALKTKKVVDFVQSNGKDVSGLSTYNMTVNGILANTLARATSAGTTEGIIVDAPNNRVPVRDSETGEPVLDTNNKEVYGRMTFVNDAAVAIVGESVGTGDGAATVFNLANGNVVAGTDVVYLDSVATTAYTLDNATGQITFTTAPASGAVITADYDHDQDGDGEFELNFHTTDSTDTEISYTMPTSTIVDVMYAERFNLQTVSELFASNEKFVDGAADTTAHLNIEQLAADLYGAGYTLDRDGNGNLAVSIQTQIDNEITARQNADQSIRDDIAAQATAGKGANLVGVEDAGNLFTGGTVEAVLTEIKNALEDYKTLLKSTLTGEGASQIGVYDAGGNWTATDVEGVLDEIDGRLDSIETGGSAEVKDTHTRDADTANLYYTAQTFTSLEARLVDIENVADAEFAKAKATTDEVVAARGVDTDLQARLDRIEAESSSDEELRIHNKETGSVGTESGVGVNAKATPDMSVQVASGVVYNSEGNRFAVTGQDAVITAADATNPRIDAVTVDSAGAVVVLAGTAGTSPTAPAVPATSVLLAHVDVPAGDTAIESAQITDKRTFIATDAEVQTARGTTASLDTRLDRALNEDGTLKTGTMIHEHFRGRFQASGGETEVLLSSFSGKKTLPAAYQVGDDSLEVFINGQLQEESLNYQEGASGDKVIFDIGDGTALASGDLVTVKFYTNNAE